ncbi:trafficking protein particle complex subunit 8 isoform X2 [Boleophthalmus pectinirostris]|uniref:trafficking protein particle complex subunit 8 isoform X2 n=1 Tax=Boleophthalmus pectinirostris TaxID=150288 RepID=UPI002432AC60|nr:trafficking protein particle complex subunit 8 isoform X2 [Boleophthalmus pectinirostris]
MAQCVQSVQELVQDSFTPMVAVLCSAEAERVSRRNRLSFAELLRPFCRLTSEGHIRDPNNAVLQVKGLRISVTSLSPSLKAPSSSLTPAQRSTLHHIVLSSQPPEGALSSITAGDYQLSFTGTTPWFEAYREAFLQTMPSSDHEFLNHYLACLLVVSSSEAVPFEQFLKLSQEQHQVQHSGEYSAPKWFIPNTLKYYVLLHDVSQGDDHRAETVYEDMKQRYGTQGCYLLKINSRTEGASEEEQIPDPWSQYLHKSYLHSVDGDSTSGSVTAEAPEQADTGEVSHNHSQALDTGALPPLSACDTGRRASDSTSGAPGGHGTCLTLNDHDRIRQFIQEFTFRGLLPHIEKNIRQLNDQLVSRKGLSRSLFTATKKWFGGGKAPEKSVAEPKSTSGLLYPPEAPELQIRKMADLCFLVQHYELAYSCYHTAKKDFLSDQAMLYAAGALEMAAVSAFLQPGAPRPYPAHYMDTAIQTYKDTCRNMVLAERCTLLSVEILKSQGKYAEAATLLIKMTSEDSDLRSALLLEQAAHCFINMRTPMVRKFAFHMILAGHRFSKAGQRRHALRCYCHAMQVYQGRGWSLAEDHINFTIGRQSFTLQRPDRAVEAFKVILEKESQQTATQQGAFLREYLYVFKSGVGGTETCSDLPLPCIQSSATRVYFGPERRPAEGEKQAATHVSLDQEYDQDNAAMWCQLELQLVSAAHRGIAPVAFQPTQYCLHSQTDNLRRPLAVLQEPIIVEVLLRNPLKVALSLSELTLLWRFTADGASTELSNEDTSAVLTEEVMTNEVIADFPLAPEETKVARLKLVPRRTGQLSVTGLGYSLSATGDTAEADMLVVRGRQELKIQGPRLNQTKEDKMSVRHGRDQRLHPIITAPMPLLEVFFLQFPSALLCGEIRKAYIEFCNMSSVGLCGLRVVSTHPTFFTFGSATSSPLTPLTPGSAENCSAYKTVTGVPQHSHVLVSAQDFLQPSSVISIPIEGGVLRPGESMQLPLWLRGPDKEGVHEINFLFYYESTEKGGKISHRVLRHTVFICSSRSLSVTASACHTPGPALSTPHQPDPHQSNPVQPSGTLVFVDVENVNLSEAGVREFHIVQVSSCGQRWCLQTCINPSHNKEWRLSSRERAKLCFRAVQCRAPSDAADKFTFVDMNLANERVVSSATPCGDFFFRCCDTKSQSPTELSPTELDLHIIVIWKAFVVEDNKQLILEGQLHVALQDIGQKTPELHNLDTADMMLLRFRSEPALPPAVPKLDFSELVRTNLSYPESHSHAFGSSSMCVVCVSLTLTNMSVSAAQVSVELQHRNSGEAADPCTLFSWVGKSQYRVMLGPEEVRCLPLHACFYSAGVYDLSSCRVLVRPAQSDALPESIHSHGPALIVINNA